MKEYGILYTLSSFNAFFSILSLLHPIDDLLFFGSVLTPLAACCYPCFVYIIPIDLAPCLRSNP